MGLLAPWDEWGGMGPVDTFRGKNGTERVADLVRIGWASSMWAA
jgi:hypothetical protein